MQDTLLGAIRTHPPGLLRWADSLKMGILYEQSFGVFHKLLEMDSEFSSIIDLREHDGRFQAKFKTFDGLDLSPDDLPEFEITNENVETDQLKVRLYPTYYVDLFFFSEINTTHVADFSETYFYNQEHVFPLVRCPVYNFLSWCPANPVEILTHELGYDPFNQIRFTRCAPDHALNLLVMGRGVVRPLYFRVNDGYLVPMLDKQSHCTLTFLKGNNTNILSKLCH